MKLGDAENALRDAETSLKDNKDFFKVRLFLLYKGDSVYFIRLDITLHTLKYPNDQNTLWCRSAKYPVGGVIVPLLELDINECLFNIKMNKL